MSEQYAEQNDQLFEEDLELDEEVLPFIPYSLTSYGADYTVDQIVGRVNKKTIYIPEFQRDYVWKPYQASQLVETLLLGLPVPGIFLSKDSDDRLLVLDGQQRLKSLQAFYLGYFPDGKTFKLHGVQNKFDGRTYEELDDEDKRRLDDSVIRATILQQNAPREDYSSSIYFIFRRLNMNATPLTSQEIRSAIFDGSLNNLLKELDSNSDWKKVFRGIQSKRKRGQELILRFFALYYHGHQYKLFTSMDDFLTKFMQRYENAESAQIAKLEFLFLDTFHTIYSSLGIDAFKRRLREDDTPMGAFNAAVFDSVMVATATYLQNGKTPTPAEYKEKYIELLKLEEYQISVSTSTGDANQVATRIQLAISNFKSL